MYASLPAEYFVAGLSNIFICLAVYEIFFKVRWKFDHKKRCVLVEVFYILNLNYYIFGLVDCQFVKNLNIVLQGINDHSDSLLLILLLWEYQLSLNEQYRALYSIFLYSIATQWQWRSVD
jgi:hypothetical protein